MAFGDDYVFLDFTIWLADPELVKELQTAPARIELEGKGEKIRADFFADPGAYYTSPAQASAEYSAPIYIASQTLNIPGITSEYLNGGSGANYPFDEARFTRKSGGWFGVSWLFGDTTVFRWRGRFAYQSKSPTIDGGAVDDPAPIPTRGFIMGFELPPTGEVNQGASAQHWSRVASRHADGFGWAVRPGANTTMIIAPDAHGTRSNLLKTWERFYIRGRSWPSTEAQLWRAQASAGFRLMLQASGQIGVYNMTGASTGDLLGSTSEALDLDRWYKIDLVYEFGNNVGPASIELWINGKLALRATGLTAGAATVTAPNSVQIGHGVTTATLGYAVDFDDWISADWPQTFDSIDWLNGTRIVRVEAAALNALSSSDWSGPWETGLQNPAVQGSEDWASTTSGAKLIIDTDGEYKTDLDRGAIGPASIVAAVNTTITGGGSAQGVLELEIAGTTLTTPGPAAGTNAMARLMHTPPGVIVPAPLTPIRLAYEHTADTNNNRILGGMLVAAVELVGIWGPEDVSDESVTSGNKPDVLGHTGPHIAPYPRSPWARQGPPPISPVAIVGFTYTGTTAPHVLSLNFPVTFLIARRAAAANTGHGMLWWSSMNAVRPGGTRGAVPTGMPKVSIRLLNPTAEDEQETMTDIVVTGDDDFANAAETYQVIAFCDPGMRFSLNGGLFVTAGSVTKPTRLINPLFDADYVHLQAEVNTALSTAGRWVKERGHAAASVSPVHTTALANALTMAEGQFESMSALHDNGYAQISYAAFRGDDKSGDPGAARVVQAWSYVGDGAASRSISFPKPTQRYPLFAIITPHNGASIMRDPSHTGTTSSAIGSGSSLTANASTGITGGALDTIFVGSALNSSGITYSVFLLPGGETALNNGWSDNGEFIPVVPAPPADWPFGPQLPDIPDPFPPEWIDDGTGGGGDGGGVDPGVEPPGDDFGEQCVPASTKVCQQALSYIGVSVPIVDVTTDQTPEAYLCRLHYSDAVAEALREFPWGWATRYATLARVAGSEDDPVSGDWRYSYRMPTDLIFARRLVRPEIGRGYDPCPPPFRQTGADATGRLLVSNYRLPETTDATAAVELEYTYRPNCAAGQGDALFRQALSWLMASKLAPALAKNKVTSGDAYGMFRDLIKRAETVNAREQQHDLGGDDAPWNRAR